MSSLLSCSRSFFSSVMSTPRLNVTVGLVMCELSMLRAMALRMPFMGTVSSRGFSSAGAEAPFCTAASMSAASTRPCAGTSFRSTPTSAATLAARGLALTFGSSGAAAGALSTGR